MLFGCSACTATQGRVATPHYTGPLATITPDGGVNPFRYLGGAAHAHIRAIDGVEARCFQVQPGVHRFDLRLRNRELVFDGEADLLVVPGDFMLTAERVGDRFEVRLLPVEGGRPAATVHLSGESQWAPLFVPLVPLPL